MGVNFCVNFVNFVLKFAKNSRNLREILGVCEFLREFALNLREIHKFSVRNDIKLNFF